MITRTNFITYLKNFLRICVSQMSAFSLLCQTEKAGKFCFLIPDFLSEGSQIVENKIS